MRPSLNARPGLASLRLAGALLQRIPRHAAWALVLGWMGLIAWLSSMPSGGRPAAFFGVFLTNLAHAFFYGLMALWVALTRPRENGWPRIDARTILLAVAVVLGYGLFDEWRQSSVPGRASSPYDVATDLVGAACTLWVVAYVPRPGASERGLWCRLATGLLLCMAAAALATWEPLSG